MLRQPDFPLETPVPVSGGSERARVRAHAGAEGLNLGEAASPPLEGQVCRLGFVDLLGRRDHLRALDRLRNEMKGIQKG